MAQPLPMMSAAVHAAHVERWLPRSAQRRARKGEPVTSEMSASAAAEGTAAPSRRWLILAGAVLVQLAIGAVYAWSVFAKAMPERRRLRLVQDRGVAMPFEVAIGMIFVGSFSAVGSRTAAGRGSWRWSAASSTAVGVILASFAEQATSSGCWSSATASSAASGSAWPTSCRSRCCRSGSPTSRPHHRPRGRRLRLRRGHHRPVGQRLIAARPRRADQGVPVAGHRLPGRRPHRRELLPQPARPATSRRPRRRRP